MATLTPPDLARRPGASSPADAATSRRARSGSRPTRPAPPSSPIWMPPPAAVPTSRPSTPPSVERTRGHFAPLVARRRRPAWRSARRRRCSRRSSPPPCRRRRGALRRGRLLLDGPAVRARGARHPAAHRSARRTRRRDHAPTPGSSRSRSCSRRPARWRMPRPSSPRPRASRRAHAVRRDPGGRVAAGGGRRFRRRDLPRVQVAVRPARRRVPDDQRGARTRRVPAVFAGWYAGADPWTSCYGARGASSPPMRTRFDVSPAWQAFVGAEPALELFASLDRAALHEHATGLAARVPRGPRTREAAAPERDRHLERPRRSRPRAAHGRRESRRPAAPAARASPSTSSTTSRTSPTRCTALGR